MEGFDTGLLAADGATGPGEDTAFAVVDDHYFSTIGMPILSGRAFDSRDHAGAQEVAIVNQTLAHTLWPHGPAVGHFLRAGAERRLVEVVGVAPDSRYGDIDEQQKPFVYFAIPQHYVDDLMVIVRTTGPREQLPDRLKVIEPRLVLGSEGVFTLADLLQIWLALPRAIVWAAMVVGSVALVLTILALYSTVFYAIGQRRAEIGIRTALGASPRDLFRLVLTESAKVSSIGAALGLVASYLLTPIAATFFVGIGNTDPTVLALVGGVAAATTVVVAVLVVAPWTRQPASTLLQR
jgi:hypothetical protein